MKIGIYGGSFDPIHQGHILATEFAVKNLKLDKLIFLPTYKNPFKKQKNVVDSKHRIKMLEIACKASKLTNYEISNFETNRKTISYTIDSVKYFKHKYPQAEIFWLIGSDNVKKLHKWKQIDTISNLTKITILKRNIDTNHPNIKKYNCLLLENDFFPYSSTDYKLGYLEMVNIDVQNYIGQNKLYLTDFLANFTTERRFKHSKATADLAIIYAKKLKVNINKAYWAALLHDLTKNWSTLKHHQLLHNLNIQHVDLNDHELHGLTASLWLEKFYLINDLDITHAIKIHTTLDYQLSLLDKIVYASDKLCIGRKWKGIQTIRNQVFQDFNKGFNQLVSVIYKHLIHQNKILSQNQQKIYQKWINQK